MIINRKIYTGAGYLTVTIKTLFGGVGRLLKSTFLLDKSETYRSLDRPELRDRVLFPQIIKNDSASCDHCKECSLVCPTSALAVKKDIVTCSLSACTRCGLCVEECSKGVLKLTGEYPIVGHDKKDCTVSILF